MEDTYFEQKQEKARQIYSREKVIRNPFFKEEIVLNSDGFHHLRYSARRERTKEEQILKFTLLPLGLHILRTAATLQEYRKLLSPVGEPSRRDHAVAMKLVQWWGFVAIFIEQDIKIRVIVRKVGEGQLHFWSVMPFASLKSRKHKKWFTDGIEEA
jgi:hypothetical protein